MQGEGFAWKRQGGPGGWVWVAVTSSLSLDSVVEAEPGSLDFPSLRFFSLCGGKGRDF